MRVPQHFNAKWQETDLLISNSKVSFCSCGYYHFTFEWLPWFFLLFFLQTAERFEPITDSKRHLIYLIIFYHI